jgi:alkylhydroperoxidase family enzyme
MPRIDYVRYDDAPPEIRDALDESAYADSEDRHLFYEMLANVPSVFDRRVDYFGELMGGGAVPRREKELAYLTVALVTDTRFVAATHARYLVDDHDVSPGTITALAGGDPSGLSDREVAVVLFARAVTRDPDGVAEAQLDDLRAAGYDAGDIVELLLLTCEAGTATTIATVTGMALSDRGETEPTYLPDEFAL